MSDLTRALRLLDLPPGRVARAVAAGVATLGSALALSALSAWLITRAWQMPPVLHLSVAVVAVRALGITRGVCRYLERLATHDVALRGTVRARSTLYRQLSQGDSATAVTTRRGDLLVRTGADVDAVFDVKAIYRHPFEEIDITRVPELFLPRTGPLALTDWEKVYAAGPSAWTDADIFAERGLSDDGVVVVVRPDQYVAGVFPLAATEELAGFFEKALLPQSAPAPLG